MGVMPPPRVAGASQPFDFEAVLRRNVELLRTVVEVSFATDSVTREAAKQRYAAQWSQSVQDTAELLEEVRRLYDVLRRLREQHLPFAGEPGAPAKCTACSLHGAQVAWPCDLYRTITDALPERKP